MSFYLKSKPIKISYLQIFNETIYSAVTLNEVNKDKDLNKDSYRDGDNDNYRDKDKDTDADEYN